MKKKDENISVTRLLIHNNIDRKIKKRKLSQLV